MILICGGIADRLIELMCARLNALGYPYRLLDMGHYPAKYQIQLRFAEQQVTGWIACQDWHLDLSDITGVYVRFPGAEARIPPAGVDKKFVPLIYAEADAQLVALFEHLPCLVANRLHGGYSNHSKPFQALIIRQCGLKTPPTLVSNDPDAVLQFCDAHHGDVICKSLSGMRSIVRQVSDDHRARLPLLKHGPAQFQAMIPGHDVRVHTVGDRYFATCVDSPAVDYRYAHKQGMTATLSATDLPDQVADACFRLARQMDLAIAGIDLRLTPDGEYYCFEANPSPGFLYYENETGQPISTALADLLLQGRVNSALPSRAQTVSARTVRADSPAPV